MMKKIAQQFPFYITIFGLAILSIIVFFRFVYAAPDLSPGLSADGVLGQTTFTGSTANEGGVSAANMFAPESVYTDGAKLYVADYTNNRVLIWNSTNTTNGVAADIILGQADATSVIANRGGSVGNNTLSGPTGVYSDGSNIYVADRENNRVLIWNTTSPVTGDGADIVLGQDVFTTSSPNKGGAADASTLYLPFSVYSDGSNIYVADGSNNRVLIWNTVAPSNGAAANIVLGQSAFGTTGDNFGGQTASTLSNPEGISGDGSSIYVSDTGNNRVLIWNTTSLTSGLAADIVLGQDTFSSGSADKGGAVSSSTLEAPRGVYSDGENIFVADQANKRVLIWTTTTPESGSGAQMVLGRSLFTDTTVYDVATSTLSVPAGLVYRNNKLFVADQSLNRVLRFDMTPISTPEAPIFTTISTSTAVISSIGSGSNISLATYALVDTISGEYASSAGNLSDSIYWVASSTWSSITLTNLEPGRGYAFKTKGRYISGLETSLSSATNFYTLANPADRPMIGTSSTTSLSLSWSSNGNSSMTTYAIFNTSTGDYLDAAGAPTSSPVYQTTSTWSAVSAVDLSPNTAYQFAIVARNGGGNTNAVTSSLSDATYTLANIAGTPTTTASSSSAISILFDTSGNPAETTYAIYNETDENYVGSMGTPALSAVYQTSSSWDGILATGLTANTAYQFSIIARNRSNVDSATSTASVALYTLASTPSSLSASVGSTSVVLQWSGDGTRYYAENVTLGTNSGWVGATQTTFTGLACGTSYTFRVKAKNALDVETSAISVAATTASCGGGGGVNISPIVIPQNAVIINSGQKTTTAHVVVLTFDVPAASEVAISNTSDFAFSSFISYTKNVTWTLSPGYGTKTVYVKFRSKNGAMSSAIQSITVEEKQKINSIIPIDVEKEEKNNTIKINKTTKENTMSHCALEPDKPYKIRTSNEVWYVTEQCLRRPIKNKEVYFSYFESWKDIRIVSKDNLASVAKDAILDLPFGPEYTPRHGSFVRVSGDENIYYILGNKKIIIESKKEFFDAGYKEEWIEFVGNHLLGQYEALDKTIETGKHLDLTLIKYPNSSKVYLLEYGKKRHVISESSFDKARYHWGRIIEIPITETYPDGDDLK